METALREKLELTTKEAARLAGVTQPYIRQLIAAKKLHATKWGRDWRIKRRDLLAWLDQR